MSQEKHVTGYTITGKVSKDAYHITLYRGPSHSAAEKEYSRARKTYKHVMFHTHYSNGQSISIGISDIQ